MQPSQQILFTFIQFQGNCLFASKIELLIGLDYIWSVELSLILINNTYTTYTIFTSFSNNTT